MRTTRNLLVVTMLCGAPALGIADTTIVSGDSVIADLDAGQSDRYRFHVGTPSTASVRIATARGLQVGVRLEGPDGVDVDPGSSLVRSPGARPALRGAQLRVVGTYTLVVEQSTGSGDYRLTMRLGRPRRQVRDLRDATDQSGPAVAPILATDVVFDPLAGGLTATDVQSAVEELGSLTAARADAIEAAAAELAADVAALESPDAPDPREANEAAAVEFLRELAQAQERLANATLIDVNNDGVGEYAVLRELDAGSARRTSSDGTTIGGRTIDRPLLRRVTLNPNAEAAHGGYFVKVFLANAERGAIEEISGTGFDNVDGVVDVFWGARLWCAYAWPQEYDVSGRRTFFVNQAGIVTAKDDATVSGTGAIDVSNAGSAFSAFGPPSLSDIGGFPAGGGPGRDGQTWTVVGGAGDARATMVHRNERHAITTLRQIALAQSVFRMSGAADLDGDGTGEFGTLRELAGGVDVRTATDGTNAGGSRGPAILAGFAPLRFDGPGFGGLTDQNAEILTSGYLFKVFLPGAGGAAVEEEAISLSDTLDGTVDTDRAEQFWCAYAWPDDYARTGRRTFFVNQTGIISSKDDSAESGTGSIDTGQAGIAFRPPGGLAAITAEPAIGTVGRDTNTWLHVR